MVKVALFYKSIVQRMRVSLCASDDVPCWLVGISYLLISQIFHFREATEACKRNIKLRQLRNMLKGMKINLLTFLKNLEETTYNILKLEILWASKMELKN